MFYLRGNPFSLLSVEERLLSWSAWKSIRTRSTKSIFTFAGQRRERNSAGTGYELGDVLKEADLYLEAAKP